MCVYYSYPSFIVFFILSCLFFFCFLIFLVYFDLLFPFLPVGVFSHKELLYVCYLYIQIHTLVPNIPPQVDSPTHSRHSILLVYLFPKMIFSISSKLYPIFSSLANYLPSCKTSLNPRLFLLPPSKPHRHFETICNPLNCFRLPPESYYSF